MHVLDFVIMKPNINIQHKKFCLYYTFFFSSEFDVNHILFINYETIFFQNVIIILENSDLDCCQSKIPCVLVPKRKPKTHRVIWALVSVLLVEFKNRLNCCVDFRRQTQSYLQIIDFSLCFPGPYVAKVHKQLILPGNI